MAPPHSEHEPGSLLRARSRLAAGRRRNNMPARFAIADARCREIPSSRAASERATFAAAIALSCFVHFPVACSLWNSIPWRFARAVARWREIPSTRAASARESPFAPGPPTGDPTPRFRPARARRRSRCARRSPPAAKAPGSRCGRPSGRPRRQAATASPPTRFSYARSPSHPVGRLSLHPLAAEVPPARLRLGESVEDGLRRVALAGSPASGIPRRQPPRKRTCGSSTRGSRRSPSPPRWPGESAFPGPVRARTAPSLRTLQTAHRVRTRARWGTLSTLESPFLRDNSTRGQHLRPLWHP